MFRAMTLFLFPAALWLAGGCGETASPAPRVDPALAFRLAVETAAAGPRPSGTAALARQAEWLAAAAKEFGAETRVETFSADTPRGEIVFRNVTATVPGRDSSRFVLIGCHYDTKKMFSDARFVGANDGASGVGALLAMIKAARTAPQPPPLTLRFVFFDGEECLYDYGPNDGLHGSRHYAAQLEKSGELPACRAMILLDMVGDRDLKLTLPQGTDPVLAQLAQAAAARLGMPGKVTWFSSDMIDDHTPFQQKGIPVINLIDFDYGPGNVWWHTAEDTVDKLTPDSIASAADIALGIAWALRG